MIQYCSVPCFKQHKESSCGAAASSSSQPSAAGVLHSQAASLDVPGPEDRAGSQEGGAASTVSERVKPPSPPLRPLTSLRWPYVPEESAYPDPLKRDDPKPLQLHQYEAIATSPRVRAALAAHPRLKEILRNIDGLRGAEREDALQRALGVSAGDVRGSVQAPLAGLGAQSEDVKALRELAEAVEAAVRGGKQDALGLDWGD